MASSEDVERIKTNYAKELAWIGTRTGHSTFLVLNDGKISIVLSRLAFSSTDPFEIEKFLAMTSDKL